MPKVARIAVLSKPGNPHNKRELKEGLPASARSFGLTVRTEVATQRISRRNWLRINKHRLDGIYVLSGPMMQYPRTDRGVCNKEPLTVEYIPNGKL